MQPPCKECARRYVGCHSKCEDYHAWKSWCENNKKKDIEQREYDRYVKGTKIQNIIDYYAKHRKKNKKF